MRRTLLIVLVCFFVASCDRDNEPQGGRNPDPEPEVPIDDIPQVLNATGPWSSEPSLQVRDLGGSKMVQMTGFAVVQLDPDVDELAERIRFARRDSLHWVAPAVGDCEVTQFDVTQNTSGRALTLEVLAWGWDKAGTSACETLFQQVARDGLRFQLEGVRVRSSRPVPLVDVKLSAK